MRNPDLVLLMTSSTFTRQEKVAVPAGTTPARQSRGASLLLLVTVLAETLLLLVHRHLMTLALLSTRHDRNGLGVRLGQEVDALADRLFNDGIRGQGEKLLVAGKRQARMTEALMALCLDCLLYTSPSPRD